MSIDLTKLSSSPWFSQWQSSGLHNIRSAEGIVAKAYEMDHAEFIALARNAFDVMLRRRWYCVPPYYQGRGWVVMNGFGCRVERGSRTGVYFMADNPFAALVAADAWYIENVEKESSHGQ